MSEVPVCTIEDISSVRILRKENTRQTKEISGISVGKLLDVGEEERKLPDPLRLPRCHSLPHQH